MAAPLHPPIVLEQDILVATFNTDGEPAFRNDAWTTILGDGDRPWQRLSDQEQGLAATFMSEASRGSLVTNELFMIRLPNWDQPLPVLFNFIPIFLTEEERRKKSSGVTITGEVLTEPTTWMSSQTQRHRLETLGRMTMGIAHDFNNLLSGILGHIELLKRTSAAANTDAIEHVSTIERAGLDGAALVRKIQQYIRHEKQTAFEPVDLNEVIEDSVMLTRPYWYNEPRRQGIAIEALLELEQIPMILGAASELRDVFVNLILNAVQAMPRGGEITIRSSCLNPERITVDVRDTGTGMTDRVRARIFEPLFTTKGRAGTGMGLAVCYGTVQEHNGDIDVSTDLGFGTTFRLSFPVAGDARPDLADDIVERRNATARILVVDDEPMVRSVLVRLLELSGHEVLSAASGSEALSKVMNNSFDIVFTDQGMPEMNGRQLAAEIRNLKPALPIVLLTGDTEAGSPDETIDLVLSKPFKRDDLESSIQQLLHLTDDAAS
ncbi:MAG: response regulator [Bacteroidetes bacterium]|nr:response regulator [Bacteroidota bacterium]